jgi:hypothetical protein
MPSVCLAWNSIEVLQKGRGIKVLDKRHRILTEDKGQSVLCVNTGSLGAEVTRTVYALYSYIKLRQELREYPAEELRHVNRAFTEEKTMTRKIVSVVLTWFATFGTLVAVPAETSDHGIVRALSEVKFQQDVKTFDV